MNYIYKTIGGYHYDKNKVVSKFEMHMSSKTLCSNQISKFNLSYKKLCRMYIILWIIYGPTLLKLFNFFMVSLLTQNMVPY